MVCLLFLVVWPLSSGVAARIDFIKNLVANNPDNPALYVRLGKAYYSRWKGRDKEYALRCFEKAKELGLESYQLSLAWGKVHMFSLNFRKAGQHFRKALGFVKADYRARHWLMMSEAQAALQKNPLDRDALFQLGRAYEALGWYEQAARQFAILRKETKYRKRAQKRITVLSAKVRVRTLLASLQKKTARAEAERHIQQADKLVNEAMLEVARMYRARGLYVERQGDWKKAVLYLRKAEKHFARFRDTENRNGVLMYLADVYKNAGQLDNAADSLKAARKLARLLGHRQREAETILEEGHLHYLRGEYDKALLRYEKAIAISKSIVDPVRRAIQLAYVREVYYAQGLYGKALGANDQALEISRENGNTAGEAIHLAQIGRIYVMRGYYQIFLSYMRAAVAKAKEAGDSYSEIEIKLNFGEYYLITGDADRALKMLNEALRFTRKLDARLKEAFCHAMRGETMLLKGEFGKAEKDLRQSLRIYRQMSRRERQIRPLQQLALLHVYQNKYEQAGALYRQARELAEHYQRKPELGWILYRLGKLAFLEERYEQAEKQYRFAEVIARKLGIRPLQWRVQAALGRLAAASSLLETAHTHYRQAVELVEEIIRAFPKRDRRNFIKAHRSLFQELVEILNNMKDYESAKRYRQYLVY